MATSTSDSPVWFVTGCSTGFDREFVRAALGHGFCVVATARDPKKLDGLMAAHEDKAKMLALDVTNADQIKHAVSKAERAFGRIDVLVNNAGYGYLAAVEEGEEKDIHAIFETNFFGVVAMIQAVLPGMRARRHGYIINIASVGGVIGHAGSSLTSVTINSTLPKGMGSPKHPMVRLGSARDTIFAVIERSDFDARDRISRSEKQ